MNSAVGDERKQYPALGGLGEPSSPAPFSGAVPGHPQHLAQGDASVPQNLFSHCQDRAAFSVNGATLFTREMVIDSESSLYFGVEQGLFYGGCVPPAQLPPNNGCVLPEQYQLQPSVPMPKFQFEDLHLLQSLKTLPSPDFSALAQETAGFQYQPQYLAMQLKSPFQLPSESLQSYRNVFAETIGLDFSTCYNPSLERLPSPDDSVSTGSDQGYFDIMPEDGYTYLPASSYSPTMATFGTESDFLIKPSGQTGLPLMPEGLPSSPAAIPAEGPHAYGPRLVYGSFSHPLHSSTSTSYTSSLPALPSPLKQQFTEYMSDDSNDSEDESKPKRKKRVRKAMAVKAPAKLKGLKPVLRCEFPGCKIACSSIPSLARHFETHKWRGKYSPVRCEACQNPLSNEFSVQRHIMRSPLTALCRRMRVYSIMRSATEVEATVRFYPKRGHGKKTKIIDLDMVKEKYL